MYLLIEKVFIKNLLKCHKHLRLIKYKNYLNNFLYGKTLQKELMIFIINIIRLCNINNGIIIDLLLL